MEITSSPLEWDEAEDREVLAQFLRTRTGQRLIPKIAESCPALLGGGDTNPILIRSGELRGFQLALKTILELSVGVPTPEAPKTPGQYAALDDDAAWGDGQKLS